MQIVIVSRHKAKLYYIFNYRHCLHSNSLKFTLPLCVTGTRCFSRNYRCTRYVKCIPTRVSQNCLGGVVRSLFGDWKYLSVQVSTHEAFYEILNEFVAAMEDPSIAREEVCLHYIKKLCAAGNTLPATNILNALRDRNIILSTASYNCLLEAAAARNDIYPLLEIFKDLLLSCHYIELMPYHILARAFSSQNDAAILLTFITEVSEIHFTRNELVLNRIIFAFGKSGQVEKSLLIYQHMKILKCRPDLVTCNTILAILGKLGRMDEILQEFAYIESVGLVPDIFTYNTMLNSLRKMGRLNLCLVYFRKMTDQGIQPDLWSFKDLIECLGRSGNIKGALEVFGKMKCMGIQPDIHIYRAIIYSLKRTGKKDLALKFSSEMNQCFPNSHFPRDLQSGNR